MRSRLLECPDAATRARCALTMLAEAMQSAQAYLYGMREGRLVFLCAQPEMTPPASLDLAVNRYLQDELESEGQTVVADISGSQGVDTSGIRTEADQTTGMHSTALLQDAQGGFYPLLLMTRSEGKPVIAAVAVLHFRRGLRKMPPWALLEALSNALFEFDDLDPLTCLV